MIIDVIIFIFVLLIGVINISLPANINLPIEWTDAIVYFIDPFLKFGWVFPFADVFIVIALLLYMYTFKKIIRLGLWIISIIRGGGGELPI